MQNVQVVKGFEEANVPRLLFVIEMSCHVLVLQAFTAGSLGCRQRQLPSTPRLLGLSSENEARLALAI